MRKSTLIIMAILIVAFGGLLIGADVLVGPLKEDIALAKELRAVFRNREWIEAETPKGKRPPVRLSRVAASANKEERLADEGAGVLLVIRPRERFLADAGGMTQIAMMAVEAVEQYRPKAERGWNFDWVELRIEAPDGKATVGRTLIRREKDPGMGQFAPPEPALTTFLPWTGGSPK